MISLFVALLVTQLYPSGILQSDGNLFLELSGSAIDEGNYRQTASFQFYKFDDKCKLRWAGKVKLNKKTRSEEQVYIQGDPILVSFYYSDQRSRYGRYSSDYLVFHPEDGKTYSLEMVVDEDKIDVRVFERSDGPDQKKEVAVLRGYEHFKCN